MKKNIIVNLALYFLGYFVPLYIFFRPTNNSMWGTLQSFLFAIVFFNSVILIFFNLRSVKKNKKGKWLLWLFILIGIAIGLYAAFVLFLAFSFRNCCSF